MLLAVEKTDDDLLTIMKDDFKEKNSEIDKSFPISGESFKRPASGTQ